MRRAHQTEQIPRHHISAFSTFYHHTSPAIESSRSLQQASPEGKEKEKWQAKHTSAHSSSVSVHTEEIFGDTA